MKALRVDVDGTVDELDLPTGDTALLAALQKATGGGYVDRVKCGEVGRITTKAEHPDRTLAMWVDDEGALGATGLHVNPLVMGLMSVIGLDLAQNLYGPIVFTETDEQEGLTLGLQPVVLTLLQGILRRLTVENLDILAARNRQRSYHAVAHTDPARTVLEVLDTSDIADVRSTGSYEVDQGDTFDSVLAELGWERAGEWEPADWLYEGEPTTDLTALLRKK